MLHVHLDLRLSGVLSNEDAATPRRSGLLARIGDGVGQEPGRGTRDSACPKKIGFAAWPVDSRAARYASRGSGGGVREKTTPRPVHAHTAPLRDHAMAGARTPLSTHSDPVSCPPRAPPPPPRILTKLYMWPAREAFSDRPSHWFKIHRHN